MAEVIEIVKRERRPFLIHATVPLLNHHTSGVRKEWYRDDLEEDKLEDPFPKLRSLLLELDVKEEEIIQLEELAVEEVEQAFADAQKSPDPEAEDLFDHDFAPELQ